MEEKSKLQLIGEIAQANNKNLELIEEINEKEDEIERLKEENNNLKFTPKTRFKDVIELREDNKRLKSIIKEVREYIKEHIRKDDEYPKYMEMLLEEYKELLGILEGDKNE